MTTPVSTLFRSVTLDGDSGTIRTGDIIGGQGHFQRAVQADPYQLAQFVSL